jgi:hypothetical protein
MMVVNASGEPAAAGALRQALTDRGWRSPRFGVDAPRAAVTTITFPARRRSMAQALARTLPPGVALSDCGDACGGVRLVLGVDAIHWLPHGAPPVTRLALNNKPMILTDASGRLGTMELLRQQLIQKGWTPPKRDTRVSPRAEVTSISYPARSQAVAKALAKTLPRGVQLIDCGQACDDVRLIIGADAIRWPRPASRTP